VSLLSASAAASAQLRPCSPCCSKSSRRSLKLPRCARLRSSSSTPTVPSGSLPTTSPGHLDILRGRAPERGTADDEWADGWGASSPALETALEGNVTQLTSQVGSVKTELEGDLNTAKTSLQHSIDSVDSKAVHKTDTPSSCDCYTHGSVSTGDQWPSCNAGFFVTQIHLSDIQGHNGDEVMRDGPVHCCRPCFSSSSAAEVDVEEIEAHEI